MLTCKLDNPNYRAKVVKIDRLEPHPGADRLQISVVDFQRIIVGLDTKIGDLYIYFPLESQINSELLSFSNSFSSADLNKDKEKKGFFGNKGRVKATKLRNVVSEGYLHPISSLNDFLKEKGIKFEINESHVGTEFDSIGDLLICQKYVVKQKGMPGVKKEKEAKVLERLVEGQFRLHCDSDNLKRNIHKIDPNDIISCSEKYHGANACFAHILCKREFSWFEKFLKKIGVKIEEQEYDYVCSSRRVIKNLEGEKANTSFYGYDIWTDALHRIKHKIQKGISIYAEVVGMLPTGAWVQNSYDYGCKENDFKVVVFRITYTNPDGQVFEFTAPQIQRYCEKYELETVPFYYYGKAKDMYPELDIDNHWHENFLSNLIRDYNEGDCLYCRNKVAREGIVIVKENVTYEPYKQKSQTFLLNETVELDKEQVNIEDEN
jgi:hypothetical protein